MKRSRIEKLILIVLLLVLIGSGGNISCLQPGPGGGDKALKSRGTGNGGNGDSLEGTPSGGTHVAGDTRTEDLIRKLEAIGYVSGTAASGNDGGVRIYDRERVDGGFNLVLSGRGTEAQIMDMAGRELHRWVCKASRVWRDRDAGLKPGKSLDSLSPYWRRVHVLENGDLLVIFDGVGIVKLDRDSNIIWSVKNGAHHDLHVTDEGTIYLLTREAHINADYHRTKPILEDYISVLDSDGVELRRLSVLDCISNSEYAPVLNRLEPWGDLLHTNTIEYLREGSGILRPGSVLISILKLDFVCAVDLEQGSVYWGESDLWYRQHQPTLLENGNILLFDNRGRKQRSSVMEFNPLTREVEWSYRDEGFYSRTCGSNQRLRNGNTLITESDPGRAFEVTSGGEIVWEYINPNRAGKNKELIAILFEVARLPRDFPRFWD